jgi:hypothetical protein
MSTREFARQFKSLPIGDANLLNQIASLFDLQCFEALDSQPPATKGSLMIIKDRDHHQANTASEHFGAKQEQDAAFYLRRAYGDDPQVLVINDLRFEHHDEVTQIDHLLVYRHGFILIESKSIYGEVRVNRNGEWSRSHMRVMAWLHHCSNWPCKRRG